MKRILLIGIGRWGANYLRVLKSMPIELFVADDEEHRLNSANIPESHRSTDARSFFPKIDAAVIVTPARARFEMCRELLEMGKDVFVEKPIALGSDEAKMLTELAEKRGLILQVGHISRFDPVSLWMRDAIAEGRFGLLKMLRANNWLRIASSRIANWVRNKLSGENISDAGCTYRLFKRECIAHVKFLIGAHRFFPR